MQFQVPQFLDVEDKVIGPLTIKQFLYILGATGGAYAIWKIIPWKAASILPAFAFFVLGMMLAFFRYNNKPFVVLIESWFNYIVHDRLYVWNRREKTTTELDLSNFKTTHKGLNVPGASVGKLEDLAFQIDAKGDEIVTQKATPGNQF
jgi:hypothetical protein